MAEVFSESLAYGQMKKRAVSARSFRVRIPSSNSTSFVPENTIVIDLPANLQNQYFNMNQLYIKMTVTSTAAYTLDRCGALGFIRRLQISTAGAQICDINNYNVLACAMIDTSADPSWLGSFGKTLIGTIGDALTGAQIPIGSTTFCIPLVLNPLAQTTPHRMIPAFGLAGLQIRLTLDSEANAVKAAEAPGLSFSGVECVAYMTELSAASQALVNGATGGKYNILATSWMQSGATLAAGVNSVTANLGFSVSSCERIVSCARPSGQINSQNLYSLGNRGTAGLQEYSYLIANEQFPARPILVGDRGAESLAELMVANHSLVDFSRGGAFASGYQGTDGRGYGQTQFSGVDPAAAKADAFMLVGAVGSGSTAGSAAQLLTAAALGDPVTGDATASDVGTYQNSVEMESGISDGKSNVIYSGISTIASTVQWRGIYGAHASAFDLDFFCQFTVLLSLDTSAGGSGVWSVSV